MPRVDQIDKRWETKIHNRIKTKTAQAKSARMYKKQTRKNRNKLSNRQFWHNTAMY